MNGELRVRVIQPLGPLAGKPKGLILTPTAAVARMWLARGWVELVHDEPVAECALVQPDENAAIRVEGPPKRKRGRPRKHPLPT